MKNQALLTLFFYNAIFVFASSLLGPLYAVFTHTVHDGVLTVSISWAAFLLSTTLCMIIIRFLGDRVVQREYLLLGGYFVRGLVWFSFPADHLKPHHHIQAFSTWQIIANITNAIGVLVGGLVVNRFGFEPLFFFMSALAFISFLGILHQPRQLI